MLQTETKTGTADNSGVLTLLCIKLLKKSKPKNAGYIGDLVVLTVKTFTINLKSTKIKPITTGLNKKIGDSESRLRGLIIRTKYPLRRFGSSYIQWNQNKIIILDRQLMPWGTRIFGTIVNELKLQKFTKIYTLGKYFQ